VVVWAEDLVVAVPARVRAEEELAPVAVEAVSEEAPEVVVLEAVEEPERVAAEQVLVPAVEAEVAQAQVGRVAVEVAQVLEYWAEPVESLGSGRALRPCCAERCLAEWEAQAPGARLAFIP
jgi:hypothetical protein